MGKILGQTVLLIISLSFMTYSLPRVQNATNILWKVQNSYTYLYLITLNSIYLNYYIEAQN